MFSQIQCIQECTGDSQCPRLLSKPSTVPFNEELPPTWHAPKSRLSLCIFRTCCFIFTWHSDLRWLHGLLKEANRWEDQHVQYLTLLAQVNAVQGFMFSTMPSANPLLPRDVFYRFGLSCACLAESLGFLLFWCYQKRATIEVLIRGRWRIFWYLLALAVEVTLTVVLKILTIKFFSRLDLVQTYLITTLAFIGVCHVVSTLGSPLYHCVADLWTNARMTNKGRDGEVATRLESKEKGYIESY
ncbi:uncharacterized protein EDB91DRAFT_121826 [Suillus paluster]|uniref:uncharacterized protein n=1 Tax=Suillus paluster TaxID=48578 RepID=UPI001B87653C|nr:uncharacterized protein EDB91DRAFT_121826 [Suillus paluster]KAG1724694.1 hypothetical protein EDB91DRAFT_121826 [Suillus paluster]